ncbi:hypothetical protein [Acidovorax sp. sic0104]|uniref:hypothetical protein n=1 Tax=Acidovorax sp. sic0104 TaxID=2854784 RepID=UPI001C437123|nr:hypothetical protein [Acidovorax sp. sic0104]MBV7542178.1 hypothetical protein [Acidovorax sp. sic0104]
MERFNKHNSESVIAAARVAMQVLEGIRATHPDLVADNMPANWGMNRLRSALPVAETAARGAPSAITAPVRQFVYILAEFFWDDDSYGEDLPVAVLYRVGAQTVRTIDEVAGLVTSGMLAEASVAIPDCDKAWLSKVAFTSENKLAEVPGFFDPHSDWVVYLGDVADMEVDDQRATYAEACEIYTPRIEREGGHSAVDLRPDADLGLTWVAAGRTSGWQLGGYLQAWHQLREQITNALM